MTPLMYSSAPGVVKRRLRYARRFSSVDSTPIVSKRFLMVPVLSSAARIPFPSATSAAAVSWSSAFVVGAISLALVAAGCGEAIPSSNGGPAALKLDGRYLVDRQGHSVYLFEKDESAESYCDGACAAVWPPLETSTAPQARAGVQGAA